MIFSREGWGTLLVEEGACIALQHLMLLLGLGHLHSRSWDQCRRPLMLGHVGGGRRSLHCPAAPEAASEAWPPVEQELPCSQERPQNTAGNNFSESIAEHEASDGDH